MEQTTRTLVMIRPANFRMNEQTAVNNFYQQTLPKTLPASLAKKAQVEFNNLVAVLENAGVSVVVLDAEQEVDAPDAVFPNNWVSFHENGNVGLYPLFAENRRQERREAILLLLEENGFSIENVIDYTAAETEGYFLEGTGSLVLDRVHRLAYCALSPRSDEELCIEFCEDFEFTPVLFNACQTVAGKREAIYHTNVMLCIATHFAVVCMDAIDDKKERKQLRTHLKSSGKEIIEITEKQVTQFAGNMLEVKGTNNSPFLVMSTRAYTALRPDQLQKLKKYVTVLHSDLSTIETCGGGSARCMLAEVFLPKKTV